MKHVRQIGAGDLDTQLHLDYTPEFVQLSKEINSMTRGSCAIACGCATRWPWRWKFSRAFCLRRHRKLEGLDISGHSTYCDETGGDYYDFLDVAGLSDKSVAIALGDVMGHGVAAAMLMATARGVLRSRCQEPGTLSELLNHMNQMLVEDTGGERFMTMLLLTIDMDRHQIRWSSAGHDAPILYDAEQAAFVEQETEGQSAAGAFR